MTRQTKFALLATGTLMLAFFLLLTFVSWSARIFDECETEIVGPRATISEEMSAFVVDYQCGATTPNGQVVVLEIVGQRLDYRDNRVFSANGEIIEMDWNGSELVIYYRAHEVFYSRPSFEGIAIRPEPVGD